MPAPLSPAARAALLSLLLLPAANAAPPPPPTVVSLLLSASPPPSPQDVIAAQVCAGLRNRATPQSALVLLHDEDAAWLALLRPELPSPPALTPLAAFLAACLAPAPGGVAAGRVRFDYAQQQLLVPNLLTLAAVLDAVPLEDSSPFAPASPLVFDALSAWRNMSSLDATAFMFDSFGNATTTASMMNPGLDVHGSPWSPSPPLSQQPDLSLADFIVSQRLFNFFLVNGCITGTAENDLMERMATTSVWPRPIAVFGYNDAWPIAGDVFEAETGCTKARDMGQVATVGVSGLSFLSSAPPISQPLAQTAVAHEVFSANKTYVTLVVGDGDNIQMVKTSRLAWFQKRLAACSSPSNATAACFPLAWTLSPRLQTVAPDVARWFFANALTTRADYFVLPPSGALYSYPSLMGPADQAAFVAQTEAAAHLYNASASVAWEVMGTWQAAIASYFPRYAERGVVRALFALNVPFVVPVVEFAENEFFKVLGGANSMTPAVLFRPFEWRGTDGSALLPPFTLNHTAMADFINAWPLGAVAHIYMTSDGGASLEDFEALVPLLAPHVRVVSPNALADLALQSAAASAAAASAASAAT
jgi:hypothetical protein